jgi:hypothetical protein
MGRTENSTERLEASRGHRHWVKEIRSNQTLFGVGAEVRSKNDLTEPALLEMSGNGCAEIGRFQLRAASRQTVPPFEAPDPIAETGKTSAYRSFAGSPLILETPPEHNQ